MSTNLTARNSSDIGRTSVRIKTVKTPKGAWPHFPPTELIPGECEILYKDPKTGDVSQRLIRYVRGMKSIFVDEWSESERKNKPKKLKLTDGSLNISTADRNLYEFVKLAGYNKENVDTRMPDTSVLYEIFDYEAKAKEAVEARKANGDAAHFIANAPLEDVRAYALALCKTKSEADSLKAESEYTIRYKLQQVADASPTDFVKGLNSSALKSKVIIHKALSEGVIVMSSDSSGLAFSGETESFCSAPSGSSVIEWFADLAVNNPDYKSLFNKLQERLSNPVEVKSEEQVSWEVQLFDNALESGKIEKSNNWYSVPGEDGKEPIMKYNGKAAMLEAIKKNDKKILSYIV